MDMVEAMRVAVAVARHKSFSSASRDLRLSAPSVSRIVAGLEADLGVRLFNRTTRQLNLTDAGLEFVQTSLGLLEELDLMRRAVRERHETPRGQLRVSCVTAFGNECLAPAMPEFTQRFPQLSISIDFGNRLVDLIGEHFDVAIRVGPLPDSSLIAQRIFTQRIVVVASPQFCNRYGTPKTLTEVRTCPSVTQVSGEWGRTHRFFCNGEIIDFEVPQHLTMNSARAVRNACLTGWGYSLLPDFMVEKDLEENRLVRLLPDHEPTELPIFTFYAQRRHTPQKIRVFVDYLTEVFGDRDSQ
ncbi:LysR family transcriptional regulator (plasmid) [Mesorhizobium sp. AR07]|uniref:LysR family transcriptional regulator n=1 Tax=Mesorhizobium sp. AR07 TaxID=2865838 RepID=UPI00215F2CED|nr:LysR family transcriptional regulator [Mesorhizobium sp. AR07]UVK49026.1 LysR family transcriptional regulator [Mesorhizobium sp. AR07]